jgi:hypothetical protein
VAVLPSGSDEEQPTPFAIDDVMRGYYDLVRVIAGGSR